MNHCGTWTVTCAGSSTAADDTVVGVVRLEWELTDDHREQLATASKEAQALQVSTTTAAAVAAVMVTAMFLMVVAAEQKWHCYGKDAWKTDKGGV